MSDHRCACGRPATHVRWGRHNRGEKNRVPCCAFHSVHRDAPHPFDLHTTPGWPHALEVPA